MNILFNKDKIVENKIYYKSIFGKIKNKNSIICLSSKISYSNNKELKMSCRLFKMYNNNGISFEYVYKILKKKI